MNSKPFVLGVVAAILIERVRFEFQLLQKDQFQSFQSREGNLLRQGNSDNKNFICSTNISNKINPLCHR